MHTSNQRPRSTVNDFPKESSDWRDDLQVDLRQRSMNEIFLMLLQQQALLKMHKNTDTLKSHHSFSSTQELKEMALKYERNIYTAATSQSDYLQKVSLKKLAIHSKSDFNRVNPSDAAFKDQTGIKRKAASLDLTGNSNDGDWQEEYQKMDTSNQRPRGSVKDFPEESGDWRDDLQLQVDLRQRSMAEIFHMLLYQQAMLKMHKNTDTLKRHHSFSGTQELKEMALKYEHNIYTSATSQSDYLQKVSLKKLAIHSKSEFNRVNPSDAAFKDHTGIKRKAASLDLTEHSNDGDWQEGYQKEIDKSNRRPTQGASGALDNSCTESSDWKAQLQADLRQRIMNKIMDTFKTHVPFSGDEGIQELKKIAVRFEDKIFNAASSESDYLYKISLKMLTAEDIFEDFLKDAYTVNPSGSVAIETVNNQGQPLPIHVSANDTQPTQQQTLLPFMHSIASTPVQALPDSTDQTANSNRVDWQEEVYQKIKAMKGLYLLDLNYLHQKLLGKLQQQPKNEQLEKLKVFKNMLERFMQFLQIPKHGILANYKDKLDRYEKQIVNVINLNLRKLAPTQQQGQALPPPHMHSVQKQSQQTLSLLKRVQLTRGGSGAGDWRAQMAASFRQRTVNNITDTLKRHLTLYGDQGLHEVKSIAESFEENVYAAATSQFDYEQKILLILNMKTRPQNHMPNA